MSPDTFNKPKIKAMLSNKWVLIAATAVVTLMLSDRLRQLPVINKLPQI